MIIHKRKLLRGGMSLGALTLLTGCDLSDNDAVQSLLASVSPGTIACRPPCSARNAWRRPSRNRAR